MTSNRDIIDGFDQLQRDFLKILLERFQEIEIGLLDLSEGKNRHEALQNCKHLAHTTKGEAGAYEFGDIGVLCHTFEDQLEQLNPSSPEQERIDQLLHINDQMRESSQHHLDTLEQGLSGAEPADPPPKARKHQVLSVGSFITFQNKIGQSLGEFDIDIEFIEDGYQALGRLLEKNFDSLITQTEASTLNGFEIISCIKSFPNPNQNLTTIVIGQQKKNYPCQPDFVLPKDRHTLVDLYNIYSSIAANSDDKNLLMINEKFKQHRWEQILMIDASGTAQRVQKSFRAIENVDFFISSNARSGLNAAREIHPDLILIDCDSPSLNGEETFQRLRQIPETASTPIILVSKNECSRLKDSAAAKPDNLRSLRKPFAPMALPQKIMELWPAEGPN